MGSLPGSHYNAALLTVCKPLMQRDVVFPAELTSQLLRASDSLTSLHHLHSNVSMC